MSKKNPVVKTEVSRVPKEGPSVVGTLLSGGLNLAADLADKATGGDGLGDKRTYRATVELEKGQVGSAKGHSEEEARRNAEDNARRGK